MGSTALRKAERWCGSPAASTLRANASIALRTVNGRGGFASPGTNVSAAFRRRFRNDSELFFNYGTPAAPTTLQRVVLKYVLRTGGGAGT